MIGISRGDKDADRFVGVGRENKPAEVLAWNDASQFTPVPRVKTSQISGG